MRRPAETISAAMRAAALTIDRVIEGHVRTIVAADNRAGLSLFKNFDLRGGRFANPFHRMDQPGVRRVFDVTHVCNPVLSMKHRIAEVRMFGEKKTASAI